MVEDAARVVVPEGAVFVRRGPGEVAGEEFGGVGVEGCLGGGVVG